MAKLGFVVCVVMLMFVLAARGSTTSRLQICGAHLAEAIKLVCNGRGYNVAFRIEPPGSNKNDRRPKRGVVDECCRQGCTIGTLESYCSPPATQNPNNLQIRKRSEIAPRNINMNNQAGDMKLTEETLKQLVRSSYSVHDPDARKEIESADTTNDESLQHHRRRLFGHSSGEIKLRHPNRFVGPGDEPRHHGQPHKHANRHKESTAGNKVKRNGPNSKYNELEEMSLLAFSELKGSDDIFIDSAPKSDEMQLVPNETTPEPTLFRHHRDRFIPKDKKQRIDPRTKKGKNNQTAERGAVPQIGTIAPYFSGHTLVSYKGFIPHL